MAALIFTVNLYFSQQRSCPGLSVHQHLRVNFYFVNAQASSLGSWQSESLLCQCWSTVSFPLLVWRVRWEHLVQQSLGFHSRKQPESSCGSQHHRGSLPLQARHRLLGNLQQHPHRVSSLEEEQMGVRRNIQFYLLHQHPPLNEGG